MAVATASGRRACAICDASLEGRRSDAETCSAACRKALQRTRLLHEQEIDDAIAMTACPEHALLAALWRLTSALPETAAA
jgi:hypothetical protein